MAERYVSCHISGVASWLDMDVNGCREGEDSAYRSPRTSMAYALTPPGILTSTLTSTREKALKQLYESEGWNGRGWGGQTSSIHS